MGVFTALPLPCGKYLQAVWGLYMSVDHCQLAALYLGGLCGLFDELCSVFVCAPRPPAAHCIQHCTLIVLTA